MGVVEVLAGLRLTGLKTGRLDWNRVHSAWLRSVGISSIVLSLNLAALCSAELGSAGVSWSLISAKDRLHWH